MNTPSTGSVTRFEGWKAECALCFKEILKEEEAAATRELTAHISQEHAINDSRVYILRQPEKAD